MRDTIRLALAFLLVLATRTMVPAQVIDFKLDGTLEGTVGGKTVEAKLGEGARFVGSVEGQGVEPGPGAPAVTIPVPDALWKPSGTLAFRIRPSRTLRYSKKPWPGTVLAKCPLFQLTLREHKGHLILGATLSTAEVPKDRTERRKALWASRGSLFWSHLKANKWYHVAFTWDAEKGRMDTYLNGSIQQEMRLRRRWPSWRPPGNPSGNLEIGGVMGEGEKEARIAVDSVRLYPGFMKEPAIAALLEGRPNFPLTNEGRWDLTGSLDLSPYKLKLVYETEFDKPLNWVHEDKLFEDDRRVRLPAGNDWVLEGPGEARTEDGRCIVRSTDEEKPYHLVFWNTREFPQDFLLEFGISPSNPNVGLTIVFFATRHLEGGSPFDLNAPRRAGVFKNYHSGFLNGYHTSYFATNPFDGGILRRTTNLRKNKGFLMPAAGIDRIGGAGPGPHRVRLLKVGGKIRVETAGRMALVYNDDGETYGPVWTHSGWIGLRQMGHTRQVSYTHFRAWKVEPKP